MKELKYELQHYLSRFETLKGSGKSRLLTVEELADPSLPACPVCQAPAVRGHQFLHPTDIEHLCACVQTHEMQYQIGVKRLCEARKAFPELMQQLPVRYRDFDTPNFDSFPEKIRLDPFRWVFTYGKPGTGKTHFLVAHMKMLARDYGLGGAFWNFTSLVNELRECIQYNRPFPRRLFTAPVLGMDDIGKTRGTGFVHERIYGLLEERHQNHLPEKDSFRITLFNSNLDPASAGLSIMPPLTREERLDPAMVDEQKTSAGAIASRMGSGYVLTMDGQDRRFRSAEGAPNLKPEPLSQRSGAAD